MKAISEFTQTIFNPSGDEWLLANKPNAGSNGYTSYKVKLSRIGNFIKNTTPHEPVPEPEVQYATATITTTNTSATVTKTTPVGATIKISTTSANSGFSTAGNNVPQTKSVSFTSDGTKYVWFKIEADGYKTATYQVNLSRTSTTTYSTSYSWGDWSIWGHGDRNTIAVAAANLQNRYGNDVQTQIYQGSLPLPYGQEGWYLKYKLRTSTQVPSTSYQYSQTITQL